ncbi:hypothetical protein ERJ75_001435500 [Trypanosoma vivax]|uniref:Uncharacterized protein n=1 Tax=Trypanosoma vivax (strain Y486) TaxID=1055687 RepID=G0TTH9_TRYVY|nr:hypothetical protein ERJ75_001435500 [Trypanosoma vivax]CCC47260.1 conserved hypothetical protein [Trypanosoma vivax Y486]
MEVSNVTAVEFDSNPLQCLANPINAVDMNAAAPPRTSRHINFVDDGKLFEGHFTVHAGSLKAIIQILEAQQAEQRVIINDLQDQVSVLRQQMARLRKAGLGVRVGGGGDGADKIATNDLDDLDRRVRLLESFRTLWGVNNAEVEYLVNTYGDPVVTPESYSALIMGLHPFRLLRSEVLSVIGSHVEHLKSAMRSSVDGASETLMRANVSREQSDGSKTAREVRGARGRNAREGGAQPSHDDDDDIQQARDGTRKTSRGVRGRNAREGGAQPSHDDDDDIQQSRDGTRTTSRGVRGRNAREGGAQPSHDDDDDIQQARDGTRTTSRGVRGRNAREGGAQPSHDDDDDIQQARDGTRTTSRGVRGRNAREGGAQPSHDDDDDTQQPRDGTRTTSRGVRGRNAHVIPALSNDHHHTFDSDGEILADLTARLEALERRFRGVMGSSSPSSPRAHPGRQSISPAMSDVVDAQARQSIEELERVVARCLRELKSLSRSDASSAQNAGGKGGVAPEMNERSAGQRPGRVSEVVVDTVNSPDGVPGSGADFRSVRSSQGVQRLGMVDEVAREDALAALDYVSQLEKSVNKRFKELMSGVMLNGETGSARQPGKVDEPAFANRTAPQRLADHTNNEEAARVLELVHDLEDDWGRRWQSLEERLRIIGRAMVNKGQPQMVTSGTIDRKAREDASMSLMRIQQLEREIINFKRLLEKQRVPHEETRLGDSRFMFGASLRSKKNPEDLACPSGSVPDPVISASQTDCSTRVHVLEKEVELRMEEVNRALATLRSTQIGQDLVDLYETSRGLSTNTSSIHGQVIINSGAVGCLPPPNHQVLSTSQAAANISIQAGQSQRSVLHGAVDNVLHGQAASIVLRSPQESFGTPLVMREMQKIPTAVSAAVVKIDNPMTDCEPVPHSHSQKPADCDTLPDMRLTGDTSSQVVEAVGALPNPLEKTVCDSSGALYSNSSQHLGGASTSVTNRGCADELKLRHPQTSLHRMSLLAGGREGCPFSETHLGQRSPCAMRNCAWCSVQQPAKAASTAR